MILFHIPLCLSQRGGWSTDSWENTDLEEGTNQWMDTSMLNGALITPPTKPGHEATTYLFYTHSNYEIKCTTVAHSICRSKSFERISFSGHTTLFTERTGYAGWMSAFGTTSGSTKTVKMKHTNLKEKCQTVGQQEKTHWQHQSK